VDGREAPILRADYLFRAVALEPGQHIVTFVFEPPSVERGAYLSAAGLAIAIGATVIGFATPLLLRLIRRARRSRGSEASGGPAA
jgi:hypothetical protein